MKRSEYEKISEVAGWLSMIYIDNTEEFVVIGPEKTLKKTIEFNHDEDFSIISKICFKISEAKMDGRLTGRYNIEKNGQSRKLNLNLTIAGGN